MINTSRVLIAQGFVVTDLMNWIFFIDIHILFPNCKFFVYMTYVQLFIIISFIIWKTFLGVLFHLIVKLSTDFTVFPDFDKELTRNVTNQQRLLIPLWHHNYLLLFRAPCLICSCFVYFLRTFYFGYCSLSPNHAHVMFQ